MALMQIKISKLYTLKSIIADDELHSIWSHLILKYRYKEINSSFTDIHSHVVSLTAIDDDSDLEQQISISNSFTHDYYTIKAKHAQLFEHSSNPTTQNKPPNLSKIVKLLKIELIKFSEDSKTWQTFIDIFDSLIHDNISLSNIDKFTYSIFSMQTEHLALVKRIP